MQRLEVVASAIAVLGLADVRHALIGDEEVSCDTHLVMNRAVTVTVINSVAEALLVDAYICKLRGLHTDISCAEQLTDWV